MDYFVLCGIINSRFRPAEKKRIFANRAGYCFRSDPVHCVGGLLSDRSGYSASGQTAQAAHTGLCGDRVRRIRDGAYIGARGGIAANYWNADGHLSFGYFLFVNCYGCGFSCGVVFLSTSRGLGIAAVFESAVLLLTAIKITLMAIIANG